MTAASASTATVARADRLAPLLAERELDALLVTDLTNLRYLTGFGGTAGACVVGRDLRLFLTDFRYVERAQGEVEGFEVADAARDLFEDVAARLEADGLRRLGFDDAHMPVRQHGKLAEKLAAGGELVAAGGLVERLRAVKDAAELRAIAAAAKLSDEILERMRDGGMPGRTEVEVARELEEWMRELGTHPAFPPIVAAGPNGALPHAEPSDREIGAGELVVVDMGCVVDGYCSDCTRTFATGDPGDEAREVYELVLGSQRDALAAVAPGAEAADVDAVARDAIEAAGHGERFGHGLGHGVGMEVHEEPRVSKAGEGALVEGNVVTIEPGVYVTGRFGVRIEDLVAVTADGHEVLTGFPKDLTIVG